MNQLKEALIHWMVWCVITFPFACIILYYVYFW